MAGRDAVQAGGVVLGLAFGASAPAAADAEPTIPRRFIPVADALASQLTL